VLALQQLESLDSSGDRRHTGIAAFQNPNHQLPAVRLVINNQHGGAVQDRQLDSLEWIGEHGQTLTTLNFLSGDLGDRQRNYKRRALICSPAFDAHRSAVKLDQRLDDR